MATTITKSPPSVVFSGNCVVWCLQSSDIGDDEIVKYTAYRLIDANGPISAMKSILPRAVGTDECINFKNNLHRSVYTSIPIPEASAAVVQDPNAIRKVKLQYGTIEVNLVECENTIDVTNESDEVTLINCALPEFMSIEAIVQSGSFIMSDRPVINQFTHYSHDYFWVYGSSSITVTAFSKNGDFIYIGNLSTTDNVVNIVPVGVIQHNMPAATTKIKVDISIGSTTHTYWFYEKCQSCQEYTEILFLERKGGRATVIFDCERQVSVSNQYETIALATPCVDGAAAASGYDRELLTKYGESISNKKSYQQISMSKIVDDDPELIEWYTQFLSSPSYHLKVKLPNGTWDYRKFKLQAGSSGLFRDGDVTILTVTGEYHMPENMPNGLV